MSAEERVRHALGHLAEGQVFADMAAEAVRPPWIVFQTVGGELVVGLDGCLDNFARTRIQITVWSATRAGAHSLMRQVVNALVNPEMGAAPLGAPVAMFEQESRLHGSRLDVSVWGEF